MTGLKSVNGTRVSYEANAALEFVANSTTCKCSGEKYFHIRGLMVFSDLLINSTHTWIFFFSEKIWEDLHFWDYKNVGHIPGFSTLPRSVLTSVSSLYQSWNSFKMFLKAGKPLVWGDCSYVRKSVDLVLRHVCQVQKKKASRKKGSGSPLEERSPKSSSSGVASEREE